MIDMNIGKRIKERRTELGLTQIQVYEYTQISSGNLSNIEKGRVLPSSAALIRLSDILQCSIDYILKGDSSPFDKQNDFKFEELSKQEQLLLHTFNELDPNDKDELLDIIQLKIRRKNRKGKLSNSSPDLDTASA